MDPDFFGEFALGGCAGRFPGLDMAAGRGVKAAQIGGAGVRAGL